jgi:hypothetical protein
MEVDVPIESEQQSSLCPECGSEESGFFCRSCGTLLHGEDMVLCPRCHSIVPEGEFCNQCGQGLSGLALELKQLSTAGKDFWVTSETAQSLRAPEPAETSALDSMALVDASELPDWVRELNTSTMPTDVKERVYPALEPIPEDEPAKSNNLFMILVLVMFGILVILVVLTLIAAFTSGA